MAFAVTLDQVMEAVADEEYVGFCIACGAQHTDVEPDARGYVCDACGKQKVYGAEELLIMMEA